MSDHAKEVTCPHCKQTIEEWITVTATMPAEAKDVLEEAIAGLEDEGLELSRGKRIAMGQVLEALCASYVAGQRGHVAALEESRGRKKRG